MLLFSTYIFDTSSAKLVWEHPYYPQYYLPRSALQKGSLDPINSASDAYKVCTISVGNQHAEKAAVVINEGPLSRYVRLDFGAMDGWFEEDDPIVIHPNDPFKRIDIRHSTRNIRVEIDGVVVAESSWAKHLYETGLPVRYYLPRTSVIDWALLEPSSTRSLCPYKGHAQYFDVIINGDRIKDLVWWYQTSPPDTAAMQNMV